MNNQEEALQNLIAMLKEFDYIRNGKESTIEFLKIMIEYFKEMDF